MFEYRGFVTTIDLKPAIRNASSDQISEALTVPLAKAFDQAGKAIERFEGGYWEITSHSLVLLENHLVVSFLLRRPKASRT